MSITKEQQQALDDALVPREQRLRIGNCNYRLSTTFKPKEPTFQVALDVLSLTPFYQAFLITVSVPAIYMHEFWATVSYHKHNIKFKMNKKNCSFDLETFGDMFQICPNLPRRKFVDPPFEEEILSFIKELGYSGNVKSLSEIKVDTLPQPWRTFGTIINKCLSGKVTGLDLLRLSRAQILWGMYHQKYVDYVYLLWEDLVYQIENKVSKKNKGIFIPQHEVVQNYGAILLDTLTNQAMKESVAYRSYYAFASGKEILKLKLKATAKVAKSGNKKLPAQGLETLSEIALTKAEQMTIVTKRSKTQFQSFHASGSGADERTGVSPGVPDVPTYGSEDEQISWKSSDEDDDDEVSKSKDDDDDADNEDDDGQDDDDQDDENEQTESENDGDDFVYPKYSTHDQEERQDKEDKEEEWSDDEAYDDETQGVNVEGEELDEEETNEEDETNIQGTQVTEDTSVIITVATPEVQHKSSSVSSGFISNMLNPNPDTGIDSILNLNTETRSLFKDRVKSLEDNFSEFQQTNQFAAAVSSIPGDIVTFKRRQDDEDEDKEPSAGSNRGSKRRRAGKELELTSASKEKTSKSKEGSKSHHTSTGKSAQAEEPIHPDEDLEEPAHQEFDIGFTEDQSVDETTQHPDWFLKPTKPPTTDHDWNKTFLAKHGPVQPWIRALAWNEDPRESFNELMDTPLDFSAFMINRLKSVELEYFLEEVCKATTDQLNWNNPEGQQYPHDLCKPLPLIPNSRGRRVIPFDHFIKNDLAYLSGGVSSRTYVTSVTKTKAADYGHIKWIEDFIPNSMWSQVPIAYDKHALWGISYWGRKRQQFYKFAVNRESARDVYSKHRILAVTKLKIVEWHNYKHLDWITGRRNDDKLYTFKEGNYNRLRLQDIEDMLLLLVQGKLTNLNVEERLALGVSLQMFTRSVVLRRRVEDIQLGVESYQKKLNLTRPNTYRSDLK
ncbi:hypothetical protein Tco_1117190 [Tanacetum coccineum]